MREATCLLAPVLSFLVVTLSGAQHGSPSKEPEDQSVQAPYQIALSTIPRSVYKENDGMYGPDVTETFIFSVLVKESHRGAVEPSARARRVLRGGGRRQCSGFVRAPIERDSRRFVRSRSRRGNVRFAPSFLDARRPERRPTRIPADPGPAWRRGNTTHVRNPSHEVPPTGSPVVSALRTISDRPGSRLQRTAQPRLEPAICLRRRQRRREFRHRKK